MIMSNFQKCKVQENIVHSGTYSYVLVCLGTGTDIIHKYASFATI
jgi:hypothetical protein